jgi:hypothetical protein
MHPIKPLLTILVHPFLCMVILLSSEPLGMMKKPPMLAQYMYSYEKFFLLELSGLKRLKSMRQILLLKMVLANLYRCTETER